MDLSSPTSTAVAVITPVPLAHLPALLDLNFADIEAKAKTALERIKALVVTNQFEADFVARELARAKNGIAKLEEKRKSEVQPLTDYSKAVNAMFKPCAEAWEEVKLAADKTLVQWSKKENERVAAEREEAERVANVERLRLAAEAEATQVEAERLAKEAHAVQDTPTGDVLNQQAQTAAAKAQIASVAAVSTVATFVPKAQTEGASIGEKWTFEIQDEAQAVVAMFNDPVLRECLTIDTVKYRRLVAVLKQKAQVAGTYVYDKGTVRSKRTT